MHLENGKVVINFSRRTLTGSAVSPRSVGIPGLTEAQAEALDAVGVLSSEVSTDYFYAIRRHALY